MEHFGTPWLVQDDVPFNWTRSKMVAKKKLIILYETDGMQLFQQSRRQFDLFNLSWAWNQSMMIFCDRYGSHVSNVKRCTPMKKAESRKPKAESGKLICAERVPTLGK